MSSAIVERLESQLESAVEASVRESECGFHAAIRPYMPPVGTTPEMEAALPSLRAYWREKAREYHINVIVRMLLP